MSASNIHPALSIMDGQVGLAYDVHSRLSVTDAGIDDPVNDTGLGSQSGDFQFFDEFAGLVQMICEGSGEFS